MNLILSNLAGLKAAVLPANLATQDTWDDQIAALGKGVAGAMQAHCNRLFERIEDDTFERSADCSYISLPRFPVEAISEVAIKVDETSGFAAMPTNTLFTLNKTPGIAEFGSLLGSWSSRVRITYTGGYWADYSELLAVKEESTCDLGTRTPAQLANKYFTISSHTVNYYVWFNLDAAGVDPAPVSKTGIEVAITTGQSTATMAAAAAAAIDALIAFFASATGTVITIINVIPGSATDIGLGTLTTGVTVNVTTQGVTGSTPEVMPVGATPVPGDLLHAWHLQVQSEIEMTNLLRGVAAKRPEDKTEAAKTDLRLIPRVTEMLRPFVRYA